MWVMFPRGDALGNVPPRRCITTCFLPGPPLSARHLVRRKAADPPESGDPPPACGSAGSSAAKWQVRRKAATRHPPAGPPESGGPPACPPVLVHIPGALVGFLRCDAYIICALHDSYTTHFVHCMICTHHNVCTS